MSWRFSSERSLFQKFHCHTMQKNNFLFIVRSYNEASRVWWVLSSILEAGFSHICVIDDGSSDHTTEVLKVFADKIYWVRHSINRWGWAALETWFEFARRYSGVYQWKYVVTFDADGQHDIRDMKNFFKELERHPKSEVIFGSRFIQKTSSNVPILRKIILHWWKMFTRFISNVHLTDAHNGYRLLSLNVLSRIHLTMDGMEYASELIDQIHRTGYRISEVPVNIHYDAYTLWKWQRYGGFMRIAIKMILNKFFL